MDLRFLHTFRVLTESASLTEAAQRLGLTQSAVSLQLQKLEREFGARLVERSRHPLEVTPAGASLLREATSLLAGYEAALEAVRRASTEVAGVLSLSASTTPGEYLVPAMLSVFLAAHPDVDAELRITDSAGVYEDLMGGRAAFGFSGARRDDLGLTLDLVAEDHIILVGLPGIAPPVVLPDQIGRLSLVVRETGSGTMAAVRRGLEGVGVHTASLRGRLTVGSTQAAVAAVLAGVGCAFLSRLAVGDLVQSGALVETAVDGLDIRRQMWLVYDPAAVQAGLRPAFLAHVRALSGGADRDRAASSLVYSERSMRHD